MSGFTFGASPAAGSSTGAGTNLFGKAPVNMTISTGPAPRPLFGGYQTPNPQQQQQQQQQSAASGSAQGSLFGPTIQQPAPSTSSNSGSGVFGGAGQAAQVGQTGTLGSLFGSTAQSSQQAQQGQLGQQQGGGGLFGQSTQTPAAAGTATGSNLFGSTENAAGTPSTFFGQSQQKPSLFGGSLGGSTPQPAQAGGLFGNASASTPQPKAGGLFGGTPQPAAQQQNSLFGFGNPSTTQPQLQSLVQSQAQPAQGSLFASANAPLGASTNLGASMLGMVQRAEIGIEERMMAVHRAWDLNSPDCRFKYFFYNVVEPGTTYRYGRPAGANDDVKWAKAMRENPDPDSMVPVLATGWADVKKRVQMQENVASVHQEKIREISLALSQLTRQTSLSSSIRLAALQISLNQLLHRLIHLAALTPQLIPILQSTAFRPEEAELKSRLEVVKAELDGRKGRPTNGSVGLGTPRSGKGQGQGQGRMLGQVNELWGAVEEIRRRRRRGGADGREGWFGDEKILAEVAEILATQQMALQKLTELMQAAVFDADVMRQGLGLMGAGERT